MERVLSILGQSEKAAGAALEGGNTGIKQSQKVLPKITFKLSIPLNTCMGVTDFNLVQEILYV